MCSFSSILYRLVLTEWPDWFCIGTSREQAFYIWICKGRLFISPRTIKCPLHPAKTQKSAITGMRKNTQTRILYSIQTEIQWFRTGRGLRKKRPILKCILPMIENLHNITIYKISELKEIVLLEHTLGKPRPIERKKKEDYYQGLCKTISMVTN